MDFRSLVGSDDKVAMEVDLPFCRFPFTQCDVNAIASSHAFTLREIGFFTFNDQKLRDSAIVQMCDLLTQVHVDPISGSTKGGGTCTSYFDRPDDFPIGTQD